MTGPGQASPAPGRVQAATFFALGGSVPSRGQSSIRLSRADGRRRVERSESHLRERVQHRLEHELRRQHRTLERSRGHVDGGSDSGQRQRRWSLHRRHRSERSPDPLRPVRLEGDSGKLLVSHDGGDGFQTIYTAKGKLLGFALAPDGKTSSRNRHDRSQKRHPEAVLTRKKWAASPKLKKPSSSGSLVRDDCGPLLEILCATPSREFSTDRRGERKGEGLSVPDLSVGAPSSSRRR